MKFTSIVSASTLFYQSITGMVLRQEGQEKPPHFILTGDSTVAIDGGWGNGFLAATKDPAGGINLAKGGATTASFRAEGLWGAALHSVKDNVDNSQPIVTIQFGHNDQKETSGLTPEQFKANLVTMAAEVLEAGGTPIIITSLTRRTFRDGAVVENLSEHSQLAIEAAQESDALYLDLNKASTKYINAIGQANADYYNYQDGDRTHLNPEGEIVFGRLVIDLLTEQRGDLAAYFQPNPVLSEKLKNGEFATGHELLLRK